MPTKIGRVVSRPRSPNPVNRSVTTLVFSVEPSASPSGCLTPSMPIPSATTHKCSPKYTPSIINATRSSSDRSAASRSASAVSVAATNRRLTADLLVERPVCSTIGGHRQFAGPVGRAHPRPVDRHPAPTQGDRAGLAAVAHRRPRGVVLALRPTPRLQVGAHHRGHHLQPRAHGHREQTFLHIAGELGQRHRHGLRQHGHRRARSLLLVVLLHSGPLSLGRLGGRPTTTARQLSGGGPPPQLPRDPGQPPGGGSSTVKFECVLTKPGST